MVYFSELLHHGNSLLCCIYSVFSRQSVCFSNDDPVSSDSEEEGDDTSVQVNAESTQKSPQRQVQKTPVGSFCLP